MGGSSGGPRLQGLNPFGKEQLKQQLQRQQRQQDAEGQEVYVLLMLLLGVMMPAAMWLRVLLVWHVLLGWGALGQGAVVMQPVHIPRVSSNLGRARGILIHVILPALACSAFNKRALIGIEWLAAKRVCAIMCMKLPQNLGASASKAGSCPATFWSVET
jgi:hypothetical protein